MPQRPDCVTLHLPLPVSEVRKVALPNEEMFDRIKELVAAGHHVTFRVKGNSMNPFLLDGRDEAMVSPFKEKEIIPGVLILAKDHAGRVILHRVIRINKENIVMMGDGNCHGTEVTRIDMVAGIVTGVVRKGKRISCRSWQWKLASLLWSILTPVRRWALAIWRRVFLKI